MQFTYLSHNKTIQWFAKFLQSAPSWIYKILQNIGCPNHPKSLHNVPICASIHLQPFAAIMWSMVTWLLSNWAFQVKTSLFTNQCVQTVLNIGYILFYASLLWILQNKPCKHTPYIFCISIHTKVRIISTSMDSWRALGRFNRIFKFILIFADLLSSYLMMVLMYRNDAYRK